MKQLFTFILVFQMIYCNAQILNTVKYDTTNSGLPNNDIDRIDITSNDVLWLQVFSNGLVTFDGTTWKKYDASTPNFPSNDITGVVVDNANNVFALGGFNVSKFNGTSWSDISTNSGIPKALAKDASGNIWLADNQLQKYNGSAWSSPVTIPSNIHYEPIKMLGDLNNNVWIINSGIMSVTKYDPSSSTWTLYNKNNVSLFQYESYFSSLKITHDNKIVVEATWNSYFFDGSKWGKLDSLSGLTMKEVNDITTRNNVSWVGMGNGFGLVSYDGVTWKKYNTNPSYIPITGLRFDSQGNLWMSALDGLYKIASNNLGVASLNELSDVALLYPNPSNGIMNLKCFSGNFRNAVADIFDLSGKLIVSFPLTSADNIFDLTYLSSGMYLLNMKTDCGSYFQKIVLY